MFFEEEVISDVVNKKWWKNIQKQKVIFQNVRRVDFKTGALLFSIRIPFINRSKESPKSKGGQFWSQLGARFEI